MKRNGAEPHLWKNLGVEAAIARYKSGEGFGTGDLVGRASAAMRSGVETLTQQAEGLKKAIGDRLPRPDGAGRQTPADPTGAAAPPARDGDGAAAPKAGMTREEALEALGLESGATPAEIDAAYKARARKNGSLNGSEKLTRARDLLRGEGS
jgi:hypothetical protein